MRTNSCIKLIKLSLLTILILLLPGCWDKLELEEQAYVVAIGLDAAEDDSIIVTCQIANPQGGGSAGTGRSENEPAQEVVSFVLKEFLSVRDLATASVTRRLTFSHTKTLIVGEEFAKTDKFYRIIEAAVRDRQIRRDTFLIVTKEPAADFIRSNTPKLETRPHKFYEFMSRRWRETGLVPLSIIRRFLLSTKNGEGIFLAIYGTAMTNEGDTHKSEDAYIAGEIDKWGGNVIELIGSAVFKDGRMVGVLNGEETRITMILRNEISLPSLLITFPDPLDEKYLISVRASKHQGAKVNINIEEDAPIINVSIPLKLSIVSVQSNVDYTSNEKNKLLLERYMENYMNNKAEKLIEKTQKELRADPFAWHVEARKKFLTLNEYENYNWREKYPDADIAVQHDIKITDFGRLIDSNKSKADGEE